MGSTLIDLTGRRYGRLVVLGRADDAKGGIPQWSCQCDCGVVAVKRGFLLRSGKTTSCGCWRREAKKGDANPNYSHGMTHTREYATWKAMHDRCTNPGHTAYPRYGGRGVTIDPRWRQFENFLEDMGPRPAGTTLDRIDNELGYAAGNCRWSTKAEQASNRRHPTQSRKYRLSEADVVDIRRRSAGGESNRAIADRYSTKPAHIYKVVTRMTWRHVVP